MCVLGVQADALALFRAVVVGLARIGVMCKPLPSEQDIATVTMDLYRSGQELLSLVHAVSSPRRGAPASSAHDVATVAALHLNPPPTITSSGAETLVLDTVQPVAADTPLFLNQLLVWARSSELPDTILRALDKFRTFVVTSVIEAAAPPPVATPSAKRSPVVFMGTLARELYTSESARSKAAPGRAAPKPTKVPVILQDASTAPQRHARLKKSMLDRIATEREMELLAEALRFTVADVRNLRSACCAMPAHCVRVLATSGSTSFPSLACPQGPVRAGVREARRMPAAKRLQHVAAGVPEVRGARGNAGQAVRHLRLGRQRRH